MTLVLLALNVERHLLYLGRGRGLGRLCAGILDIDISQLSPIRVHRECPRTASLTVEYPPIPMVTLLGSLFTIHDHTQSWNEVSIPIPDGNIDRHYPDLFAIQFFMPIARGRHVLINGDSTRLEGSGLGGGGRGGRLDRGGRRVGRRDLGRLDRGGRRVGRRGLRCGGDNDRHLNDLRRGRRGGLSRGRSVRRLDGRQQVAAGHGGQNQDAQRERHQAIGQALDFHGNFFSFS